MTAVERALRDSARIRSLGPDLRLRIRHFRTLAAFAHRAVRRMLAEPPLRPGEARIGLDSGVVVAWLVGVLLSLGAALVAAIGAAVLAALW